MIGFLSAAMFVTRLALGVLSGEHDEDTSLCALPLVEPFRLLRNYVNRVS